MIDRVKIKLRTFLQDKRRAIIISVSIIFWLAAIVYSIYMKDRLPYPDEQWYFNDYAQNIANLHIFSRDGINPTAFHPPLYPLMLGGLVSLGLGITAVRLVNFLAMFLTLLGVYKLLKNRLQKISPILAVLIALAYLVLFYTAGTLFPQTLGAMFFILAIMFYWKEHLTTIDAILSGITLGLAVLTIPTFIYLPFFLLIFSIFFKRDILKKTILLFIVVFITIAPWTLRNFLVFDRFELVSNNFGTNFLIGNAPSTTPNNGPIAAAGIAEIFEEANRLGLDEFEKDDFYTNKALSFIEQDPGHYIKLYVQKVINYFNYRNNLLTASESSQVKDYVMLFTYGSMLIIASIRILLVKEYPVYKLELFLLFLYVGNAFISALAFTRIRYRLPFDYLLIIFISIFLESVIEANKNEGEEILINQI